LTGGKAQTIVTIADALDLDLQVMGARLQEADKSSKPAPRTVYDLALDMYAATPYLHDQYLVAGRLKSDFMLNKILKDIAEIELGVNFVEIMDAKDTGVFAAPAMDSYVGSADLKAKAVIGDIKIALGGEFAMSYYTANKWAQNYVSDMGIKADLEIKGFDTALKGTFISNGRDFTSYAAQTRMYNEAANVNGALYLTQNNTWNLMIKPPLNQVGYEVGGHVYPFTQYNPQIVVSYNGSAGKYGNLLAYPIYENNIMPYGDATPDRFGFIGQLSGNYLEEMIQPMVKVGVMSETNGFRREMMSIEAGTKVNWQMLSLTAGYRMETTAMPKITSITPTASNFDSSIIDVGLEYTPIKKKLVVFGGLKMIGFKGHEAILGDGQAPSSANYPWQQTLDATSVSMGGGVEYRIAKPAVIGLSYTATTITDNEAKKGDGVQELDARISINF
jgi:hypothetical protein